MKNTLPMPTNPHLKSKDRKTALESIKENTQDTFQQIKSILSDFVEVKKNIKRYLFIENNWHDF